MTADDPGASDALRVVVCDDATLNRECLAEVLQSRGIHAESAWDLPSLLEQLDRSTPDVILLNIGTPDAATLLQVSLDVGLETRVIVTGLSEDNESDIVACAEAGVAGLHLRTETIDQLLTVINRSADEESVCSPAISAVVLRRVYSLVGQPNSESKDLALTDREHQILRLLEDGLSNQQIASRLNVSIHTVKNHLRSLFSKLAVSSRAEAVAASRAMRRSNVGSS